MNDIEEIIKILDGMAENEVSRMKIETSAKVDVGEVKRTYHHGRCDVGSPWAKGDSFDLCE